MSSPRSLSAGGQDEHPWLVNSSMTARVSPEMAGPTTADDAQATTAAYARLSLTIHLPPECAPDVIRPVPGYNVNPNAPPFTFIGVPAMSRHSRHGEPAH